MRAKLKQFIRSDATADNEQEKDDQTTLRPHVPPQCPPDWRTGPQEYVGVGAQKAGTTWFNQAISSHPQVHSGGKELHFFERHWNEEFTEEQVELYHQYFPRPEGKICGEWTPRYMLDLSAPRRLRMAAPDARILVLLRDPIARLRSGLRHMESHHPGQLHPRMVNEAILFGRYGEQLNRLAQHFPRSQILVLQFERCVKDPEVELARTFEFIGVDASFVPDNLHMPVNEARRSTLSIPTDLMEYARDLYMADLKFLSDWPEIDIDLWPEVRSSR